MSVTRRQLRDQRGQVVVLFALLLPVLFALGAVVIAIGNWFTHAKHLQTKADAGALAGGGEWQFPCGPQIDARIGATARLYAGTNNPQVGGVPSTSVHTALNALNWYDDDEGGNAPPPEFVSPAGPVCQTMTLDVKVTEDNSFPLASLMPFFPDIKRKARVEIQEAEGATGLLPIAVRAPDPVSAAAVFYNEENGQIRAVKYLVRNNAIFPSIPGGLQGWTSYNPEDDDCQYQSVRCTWAEFAPSAETGVVIAISFRGACNDGLPNPNTKIVTTGAPCLQDQGFSTVDEFCNQGGATQIVECHYATGNWPSQSVGAGLQFIRGYPVGDAGSGPPQLRSAWIDPAGTTCAVNGTPANGYFNAHPSSACTAVLRAVIDLGRADPDGNGPRPVTDRSANNAEVRYRIVNDTGNYSGGVCTSFGTVTCSLIGSGSGGNSNWSTTQTLPRFNPLTRRNAIVMRIRLNDTRVGNTQCPPAGTFNANCEWFFISTGTVGNAPNDNTALANPVQRMFRGSQSMTGSIQYVRLTTDSGDCSPTYDYVDGEAASQPTTRCFYVDVGLKGGVARDANEPALLFTDGTAANQTGTVDCDPAIPQGQELEDGVVDGCKYWYGKHPFNYPGPNLCPTPNNLFTQPNPGAPWNDGSWPPLRCIDTRQTGTANQLERGLKLRLFGDKNANSCPPRAAGFVQGRNYWDKDTDNGYAGVPPLGYKEGNHDTNFAEGDKRIVTIFLSTTEAFTRPPSKTHPVTGFITVYITGFGRLGDAVNGQSDDPCPGSAPPPDIESCQGNQCNNYVVWGHIINYELDVNALPSGRICDPVNSSQPCVAVLVE